MYIHIYITSNPVTSCSVPPVFYQCHYRLSLTKYPASSFLFDPRNPWHSHRQGDVQCGRNDLRGGVFQRLNFRGWNPPQPVDPLENVAISVKKRTLKTWRAPRSFKNKHDSPWSKLQTKKEKKKKAKPKIPSRICVVCWYEISLKPCQFFAAEIGPTFFSLLDVQNSNHHILQCLDISSNHC